MPADPFASFAPQPVPPPGPLRRAIVGAAAVLRHEWTLACLGGLLLAVLVTWPTLADPLRTIPQDVYDPTLQAWQMSWAGHILSTDPGRLWHANAFYPERYSFAFSDTLLGYAPAGLIGNGPAAAILRYNIMYVLVHALAFVGTYALVRQLGSGRTGAAVAGAAFAYAPWRLAQAGHMHILSSGGIVLAFAMLARGHGWSLRHGYRPDRRHTGWAVAGWVVAAWQLTIGFGIGLPFAYALALICAVATLTWLGRGIRSRRPFGRRLLIVDLAGGLLFAGTGALLALPYLRVADLHPQARRSIEDLQLYSAPWPGLFTAPPEHWLWGGPHTAARAALPVSAEMTLLPGYVLTALALTGLVFSVWSIRQRLLLAAGVLVTAVLALGTQVEGGRYTYLLFYDHLPGWDAIRTPGRLILWTTLLLAVLAAGAVSELVVAARSAIAGLRPTGLGWLRWVTLVPLALVLVEAGNVTPHPVVPAQPGALREVSGPMLVLPSDEAIDNQVMLWTTNRFQPLVNGNSGFTPDRLDEVRWVTESFPDTSSVSLLRSLGVRTVMILPDRLAGTPWEQALDRPTVGLGITRRDLDGAIVFDLPA